jgi:hypothetical protein
VWLLALSVAVARSGAQPLAPPTGDAGGLTLLERVHQAYVGVPAVTLSGRAGSLSFRFTLLLHKGRGIAEQFVSSGPSGTTKLVARRGSPTFAREPGSSCWRPLAASDPQSFENIGLPFPDQPHMRLKAPRQTATEWLLPVVADGGPGTFAIDRKAMLIRSFTLTTHGIRIIEQARALHSAPTLLLPQPRC